MFFHIGDRHIISGRKIIGIFSRETIEYSDLNEEYKDELKGSAKSVIIDDDDEVILSSIHSSTLIERKPFSETDFLWKRRT